MDETRPDDIDGIFKDSLQPYLEGPAESVWKKIENQLDREDGLFYKSRFRLLLRICVCLLVVILALGTLILVHFNYGHQVKGLAIQENKEGVSAFPGKTEDKTGNDKSGGFEGREVLRKTIRKDKLTDPGLKGISDDGDHRHYNMFIGDREDLLSGTSVKSQEEAEQRDAPLKSLPAIVFQPLKPRALSFNLGKNDLPADLMNDLKKITISDNSSFLRRVSLTAYFSQEFAGYNLSDNNDITGTNGKEIEKRERHVFSASGGIFLDYKLNKRWIIQSGLSYSWSNSILYPSESFAVKDNNGNVQFKVNTISGYGYLSSSSLAAPGVGDSVMMDKVYSNLHYLTIPLIASYRVNLKKFTLLAGAGFTFNFLTSATIGTKILGYPNDDQESVVAMNGLKRINYGILLKAEFQYNINSSWGINLIPCFKNALSPINIHSALSTYPYNFGIGLGISHRF